MSEIPRHFRTEFADRMMLSWRDFGLGEMIIQFEMLFEDRLDEDRLRRALELVLVRHPILGCRMVVRPWHPRWERIEGRPEILTVAGGAGYDGFRREVPDPFRTPQMHACLFRSPEGDRLNLRLSHLVCDAGGTKEVSADLGEIYRRLDADPGFVPEPRVGGSRAGWQVLKHVPLKAWFMVPLRLFRLLATGFFPFDTLNCRLPRGERGTFEYSVRHLSAEMVSGMAEYGRARGATLNDMLVAAWYRALASLGNWDGKTALRVRTTVDLRRWYQPGGKAEALCNLSSFEYPYLGRKLGGNFSETLGLVAALTRGYKRWFIGLAQFPTIPPLEMMPYSWLNAMMRGLFTNRTFLRYFAPALTNMGPIPPEAATFKVPAKTAWLLVPPIYPPSFGSGFSGYNGTLTLSAGLPPAAVPGMERFYDEVEAQLP